MVPKISTLQILITTECRYSHQKDHLKNTLQFHLPPLVPMSYRQLMEKTLQAPHFHWCLKRCLQTSPYRQSQGLETQAPPLPLICYHMGSLSRTPYRNPLDLQTQATRLPFSCYQI